MLVGKAGLAACGPFISSFMVTPMEGKFTSGHLSVKGHLEQGQHRKN